MSGPPASSPHRQWIAALAGALALLLALSLLASLVLGRVVARALSRFLDTPVEVASAHLGWLDRSLTLSDVRILSPLGGTAPPLLHAATLRADAADLGALWSEGRLHLAGLHLISAEITTEGSTGGGSTIALLQAKILGGAASPASPGNPAVAAQESPGAPASQWVRRLEVERLVLTDLTIRARAAAVADESVLRVDELALDGFALPLAEHAGSPGLRTLAMSNSTLRLKDPADREVQVTHAAEESGAAGLVLEVPTLEASGIDLESAGSGTDTTAVQRVLDLWLEAIRRLDLPEIASLHVAHASIDQARFAEREVASGRVREITQVSIEAQDLRRPPAQGEPGTLSLRGRPLSPSASVELNARGSLLTTTFEDPVSIGMRFRDVPLSGFSSLHLRSGQATGKADMTLERRVVRGVATFRLLDLVAAADAPEAQKVAYTSFDVLTASGSPDLTVPFVLDLSDPRLDSLGGAVARALAERVGGSAAQTLRTAADSAEDAARQARDAASRAARGATEGLRQGLQRLLP